MKWKPRRACSVTDVLQSAAQGAVLDLPIAWVQRFPSRRVYQRIGNLKLSGECKALLRDSFRGCSAR